MDPILLDIPESFETDRLLIRVPKPGDGPSVNEAVRESFAELHAWMPWAAEMPSVADSELNARRAQGRFHLREDLSYRAYLKVTDTLVVGSGLHRIDWSIPRFEIGYWCRTSLVGRGYASEVVRALTVLALEALGAKRVEIKIDARNLRSRRVAERCGFTLEGTLRNAARNMAGGLCDDCVYSIVR